MIYAGTVYLTQLGSGTLPVGVVYANSINVSQLVAGTATFSGTVRFQNVGGSAYVEISGGAVNVVGGSFTSPAINGGAITGATEVLNLNGVTTSLNNVTDSGFVRGVSVLDNATNLVAFLYQNGFAAMHDGAATKAVALFALGSSSNPYGDLLLNDTSGGHSIEIASNGPAIKMNGAAGFTGTLAAAISAGKNVVGGVIIS